MIARLCVCRSVFGDKALFVQIKQKHESQLRIDKILKIDEGRVAREALATRRQTNVSEGKETAKLSEQIESLRDSDVMFVKRNLITLTFDLSSSLL